MNLQDFITADMFTDINISLFYFVMSLFSSAIGSLVIRFLYIRYGRSMNNREYFANTFLVLCLTTCTVIVIVKYSLALSLGLVGALSIVRFRAAIKEPEELIYLFLIIAIGLSFGANQFLVGYIFLIVAAIVIILSSIYFLENNGLDHSGVVLVITGNKDSIKASFDSEINKLINQSDWAALKEISIEDGKGRIVINCSTNKNSDQFLSNLMNYCHDNGYDYNLISDINVPN